MFLGLTFEKLVLIGVLAAVVLGPERLPRAAEWLAKATKRARAYAQGARERMRDEMGDDFDEVDWRKLDPRQYDPRRIIREALLDDAPAAPAVRAAAPAAIAVAAASLDLADGEVPPYDSEAT
ncbi:MULTISPECIES: Sec-independent protein translocase subunit TatA/TatB [Microbacterium]|uniref:Sec-independent protein translocase subunit TatA/TatB n=1 Tax=Microbacterium TaxID=33882 RepID=UPI0010F597BE|nr:Sec-independent protein translocase TatB [Microbacterium sp. 4NA327F11]MCK9920237.1 Sec-independent protein translocase TatB [Microbacteriaceae bacterium K1510]